MYVLLISFALHGQTYWIWHKLEFIVKHRHICRIVYSNNKHYSSRFQYTSHRRLGVAVTAYAMITFCKQFTDLIYIPNTKLCTHTHTHRIQYGIDFILILLVNFALLPFYRRCDVQFSRNLINGVFGTNCSCVFFSSSDFLFARWQNYDEIEITIKLISFFVQQNSAYSAAAMQRLGPYMTSKWKQKKRIVQSFGLWHFSNTQQWS